MGMGLTIHEIDAISLLRLATSSQERSCQRLSGQRHLLLAKALLRLSLVCYRNPFITPIGRLPTTLLSFSESRQARYDGHISSPTCCLDSCVGNSSISGVACLLHDGPASVHVAVAPCRSFRANWLSEIPASIGHHGHRLCSLHAGWRMLHFPNSSGTSATWRLPGPL